MKKTRVLVLAIITMILAMGITPVLAGEFRHTTIQHPDLNVWM